MATKDCIRNPMSRVGKVSGTFILIALAILPFVAGCGDDCSECPDPAGTSAPPFPPDGVFSITGDGVVTVCWNQKTETNIAAYGIYRNPEPTGKYTWIADVSSSECEDGLCCYDDKDVQNGETWWYAVTAINDHNQESADLSYEFVDDTPRPEDYRGLVLMDYLGQDSGRSGYDFSDLSNTARPWNDNTTDIYFGVSNGVRFIYSTAGVEIQDYGIIDLVWVDEAPTDGWAPSGRVEAIPGHSYIVRIPVKSGPGNWNVAKFEVVSVSNASVTMYWAYQEVVDLPELTPGGGAMR